MLNNIIESTDQLLIPISMFLLLCVVLCCGDVSVLCVVLCCGDVCVSRGVLLILFLRGNVSI